MPEMGLSQHLRKRLRAAPRRRLAYLGLRHKFDILVAVSNSLRVLSSSAHVPGVQHPRNVHAMNSSIPSASISTTFSSAPSSLPDHPPDDVPAHHASPVVAFIIGLGIVTLASIMNAAGLNLTKLDHVRRSLLRSSDTQPMLCGTTGADECDSEGSAEEGLA